MAKKKKKKPKKRLRYRGRKMDPASARALSAGLGGFLLGVGLGSGFLTKVMEIIRNLKLPPDFPPLPPHFDKKQPKGKE